MAKYNNHCQAEDSIHLRRYTYSSQTALLKGQKLTLGDYSIYSISQPSSPANALYSSQGTELDLLVLVCNMIALTLVLLCSLLTCHICACLIPDRPRRVLDPMVIEDTELNPSKSRGARRHSTVSKSTAYTGTYLQIQMGLFPSAAFICLWLMARYLRGVVVGVVIVIVMGESSLRYDLVLCCVMFAMECVDAA